MIYFIVLILFLYLIQSKNDHFMSSSNLQCVCLSRKCIQIIQTSIFRELFSISSHEINKCLFKYSNILKCGCAKNMRSRNQVTGHSYLRPNFLRIQVFRRNSIFYFINIFDYVFTITILSVFIFQRTVKWLVWKQTGKPKNFAIFGLI